jgi:hypothetical protein
MLELDVNDVLALSSTKIFQPMCIEKMRSRHNQQYYEIVWKPHVPPSSQILDEQMNNLSLMAYECNDDNDEEKLLTIEPADLFRHAYPEVVHRFETPRLKPKKMKSSSTTNYSTRKKTLKTASTSMSLDLLSMLDDRTQDTSIINNHKQDKPKTFHHRSTMVALSTSMNIDVLSVLDKSHGTSKTASKKVKSRAIQHQTRSDMIMSCNEKQHRTMCME